MTALNVSMDLPKSAVYLIGDSISIDYHPYLAKYSNSHYGYRRKDGMEEALQNLDIPAGANGGDCGMVVRVLRLMLENDLIPEPWIAANAGLHDIKMDPLTGRIQVPVHHYRNNLQELCQLVRNSGKQLAWISTTPVDEEQHARFQGDFLRREADHAVYAGVAKAVMSENQVPVIDLGEFTLTLGKGLYRDHVHFVEEVCKQHALFVHRELLRLLDC